MDRFLLIVPAYFAGAGLFAWGANWLAAWRWRRSVPAHWTERARLLWPVRQGAAYNILLVPAGLIFLQYDIDREFSVWCMVAGLAGWLGMMIGTYPLDREILPRWTFREWLRLVVLSWSRRFVSLGVWIAGCFLMPLEINWVTWLVVAGYLAVSISFNWLWRRLLTRVKMLRPADDRLQEVVTVTALRMGVSKPKTFLLEVPVANAWALPLTRELIFTQRLLEICNDDEVSTICAHELAHLTESKRVIFLRVMGSLIWFPFLFARPLVHAYGLPGLLFPWLILWAAPLFRKLGRRMEKRADSVATEQQSNSGVYARALEKLYEENQMPAVHAGKLKTHPHLYDRMLEAGIEPGFPRPKPPESVTVVYFLQWIGAGLLIAWYIISGHSPFSL